MKIDPASAAGALLVQFGVTPDELRAASFHRWDLQLGGAITVALPGRRARILMRSHYLPTGADGQLTVGSHLSTVRHELCHVRQLSQWGFLGYWWRHLMARIRTRSVLAQESEEERPCYEAQAQARDELANLLNAASAPGIPASPAED